ncbi:MAG: menaquinone biosynthesis family protein [Elusimicrobiota bacterium]
MTSTEIKNKVIRFGHTPEPDDAYMFFGLAKGVVKIDDYKIEHILEDIESLNQKAIHANIDVTAISTAVYPQIAHLYWILPTGASVGRNYGPVVVKKKGIQPKTKKIGVPGLNTTAYLLFRLYFSGYEAVPYQFDLIPSALEKGEIDFGILIHEAQLTYEKLGFEKIADLGVLWMEDTHLPIPLGLDVVRKDLGKELCLKIWKGLKESIIAANEDRANSIPYALQYGRGLETKLGEKFVGMYVNEDTLDMGEEGEKAINILFEKAFKAGIFNQIVKAELLKT